MLVLALPAGRAAAHAVAVDTIPTGPLEVVSGTVVSVRIENRVSHTSSVHRELRLDGGGALALRGTAAETLSTGARVFVTGRRAGSSAMEALSAQVVSTPAPSSNIVQVEGTLAIAHADDFANNRSQFAYDVRDDTGGVTVLNVSTLPPSIRGGSRVRVSGKRAADGSSLDPESITIDADPAGASAGGSGLVAKSTTNNSVLVILANFNNTAAPAYTSAQAQQTMVSSSGSVANFYSEVSYGSQLLNVTVTSAWVTMNLAGTCDYTQIAPAANAAAQALSSAYNASNYNFVVYLFTGQSCGWSGLAYVGYPHLAFINGIGSFITQVIAHEMGHNFGLLHAGSLSCGTAAIGGSCGVAEYGDPWDTMGNQRAMHFNAAQKSLLGWIPPSSVITHNSGSATYTLSPLETGGASTYAVKIPTSNTSRTYWLEFRQPIGFDAPLSGFPVNGAQVRVSSPFEWMSGSDDTQIVDMTPGSGGGFGDSALVVGQTYVDSTYGVNITVTGATASALSVSVTKGGGSATTTTLGSSSNPSSAGSLVTLTASVTGSNPTGSVNFLDGGVSITGCGAVALSGSGNTRTAACAISSLSPGTHSIVASYGGDGANLPSGSTALSQTVNGAGSTTGIATSLTPSTVGTNVTFTATVSGTLPTGTVNFKDGSASIGGCSSSIVNGSGNIRTATCNTSVLAAGSHSVTALYSGDSVNSGSTSSALTEMVNRVSTASSLSSSTNPSAAGVSVTFTASVTGYGPTGSVNFTDGGTSISGCSAVALTGSGNTRTAQCSTSALTVATHSIRASYGGDSSNQTSASSVLSQVVNTGMATATTKLASSANPTQPSHSVTFTATVTGSNPTGSVAFTSDGTTIANCGAVPLSGSGNAKTAKCMAGLPSGTHTIVATYGGDGGNSKATSAPLSEQVKKR